MSIATRLDLATRTHRAARELRLADTRMRSALAIGKLVDEAAAELPALRGVKRAELRRAIEQAVKELKASVGSAPTEGVMS